MVWEGLEDGFRWFCCEWCLGLMAGLDGGFEWFGCKWVFQKFGREEQWALAAD